MFGLCDCNNFYASCERLFNPSLEGRPIVVLSNNDGCVIARSNESKALGIKMGAPLFTIRDAVKQHNIKVFSSNYQLYGDISERVMSVLRDSCPAIEVYSIDEAFLDLSSLPTYDLPHFGRELAKRVRRHVGIPVSIGMAATKTLAKVASKLCKSYPKLDGACLMYRPEDITKVLTKYSASDVWGIGRRSAKMLAQYGITTAEQFRQAPPEWVAKQMSITGLRTWHELHGTPQIEFEHMQSANKSILVSRSFAKEIYDFDALKESITTFTTMAAERLRKQQSVAAQMQLFILTNRHREDQPQYNHVELHRFDPPTDSTLEMIDAAVTMLRRAFRQGFGYKKGGITLTNLCSNSVIQSSIFDTQDRTKHSSLMKAVDKLNSEHGRHKITFGATQENSLRTNRNHLSPCYTTKWEDILKINV